MTYANHDRGFALASRRSPHISRLYVQCSLDNDVANWPTRSSGTSCTSGSMTCPAPRSRRAASATRITPCRSFVLGAVATAACCLAGDAWHIVPPTGAKGLNLAVADVRVLSHALIEFFQGKPARLDRYSDTCLKRVWKAVRYSTYMTTCCTARPTRRRSTARSRLPS